MWALLSEWLKKAGMALKHAGLTISQNNRQGETHTWISQKETRENKQSPKLKEPFQTSSKGKLWGWAEFYA